MAQGPMVLIANICSIASNSAVSIVRTSSKTLHVVHEYSRASQLIPDSRGKPMSRLGVSRPAPGCAPSPRALPIPSPLCATAETSRTPRKTVRSWSVLSWRAISRPIPRPAPLITATSCMGMHLVRASQYENDIIHSMLLMGPGDRESAWSPT